MLGFDPHTKGEQVLYELGNTQLHDAADARRSRLLEVREGIPDLLWVVLVLGGAITVSFTYLFGLQSNLAHSLMVAALTLVICGILFTIGEFNNPFSGVVEIRPDAFERGAGQFRRDLNKDLLLCTIVAMRLPRKFSTRSSQNLSACRKTDGVW